MTIRTTNNNGIHLTTKCGVIFSLQFGYGTYSDNYDNRTLQHDYKSRAESCTCEVMVCRDNDIVTSEFFSDAEHKVTNRSSLREVMNKIMEIENG